jgi:translation initiation factor 3 subunit K
MATEQAAENYTVEDLVALNPYNPDILNDLEKFVNEQVNPSHRPADALASAFFSP